MRKFHRIPLRLGSLAGIPEANIMRPAPVHDGLAQTGDYGSGFFGSSESGWKTKKNCQPQ